MTKKRWITFISLSVLTSLSLLGFPQESQAQQDKFFTKTRVEVLRTNEGAIDNRIDPVTLEQSITDLSATTDIKPYVVIAAKDNLSLNEIKQFCKQLKQQVLAKQDTNPAFSKQDFLLLVYATSTCKVYDARLQKYVDTQPGWLDVEAGDRLRDKYGLTESRFSATDGPVEKAIKRYMSQGQRPQAFIQAVVQNVCDEVKAQDQQASQAAQDAVLRQEREAQRAKEQALENERLAKERVAREAQAKMERQKQSEQTTNNQADAPNALSLVLVLAGLTVFGFVITFFLRKNKAADKISKWEETIQNLDGWYLELHNEFGTTMNRKPTGQTKKDLERALTSVAEFTLRRNAAPERLDEAKIAFRKNVFPFSSGFARAIDLLTSVPILVEVRKVPIEEADPLKGFYRDLKETPSDLQRNARSFFQEAVIIFSTIEKAGEILSEIETSFANLVKETISELGPKFKEAGIKFEGIELRVTEIRRSFSEAITNAKAKGTIDSDPFALIETLNRFTEEILQLKEASKKLLNLNNRLIDTNRRCIKAENHINQLRSTPVDYRYPLAIGEFPEPAFAVNYRLIDTSGERTVDAWLESSKSSLAQATQIMRFITADPVDRVFGSDMSDLAKLVLRANGDIDQIDAIITFTFKCKTIIESNVPKLRNRLDKIVNLVNQNDLIMRQLWTRFVISDFKELADTWAKAQYLLDTGASQQLMNIKAFYEDQRYSDGASFLESSINQAGAIISVLEDAQDLAEALFARDTMLINSLQPDGAIVAGLRDKYFKYEKQFSTALLNRIRDAYDEFDALELALTQRNPIDCSDCEQALAGLTKRLVQLESDVDFAIRQIEAQAPGNQQGHTDPGDLNPPKPDKPNTDPTDSGGGWVGQ